MRPPRPTPSVSLRFLVAQMLLSINEILCFIVDFMYRYTEAHRCSMIYWLGFSRPKIWILVPAYLGADVDARPHGILDIVPQTVVSDCMGFWLVVKAGRSTAKISAPPLARQMLLKTIGFTTFTKQQVAVAAKRRARPTNAAAATATLLFENV